MRRGKPLLAAWMVAASAGARFRISQSSAGFVSRFFRSAFQVCWGCIFWSVGVWGGGILPCLWGRGIVAGFADCYGWARGGGGWLLGGESWGKVLIVRLNLAFLFVRDFLLMRLSH